MAGWKGGRIDDDAVASRMIKKNNDRNDQHNKSAKKVSRTVQTKAAVPEAPAAPKPFGGGGNVNDMTGVDTGGMMPQDSKY